MAKKRAQQRIEDEKKLEEVRKLPVVAFDEMEMSTRMVLVYESRLRGKALDEIAEELNTSEPSVRETLNLVAERFLSRLDDMRTTHTAVNIQRLEWIIAKLMKDMEVRLDRDVISALLKAIKLEDTLFKENIAPRGATTTNNVNVFIPTMSRKSPLYEKNNVSLNSEDVEHFHPEVYARHKDVLEDPRIARLNNLLPVEVESDDDDTDD